MNLSWGIPTLKVTNLDTTNGKYAKTETEIAGTMIVEDTTELSSEEGDTIEATVEGGSREAVRRKETKYTLKFNIRKTSDRASMPFEADIDWNTGNCGGEYKIQVEPELDGAYGFTLYRCNVHVSSTFNANDGLIYEYTCESLTAESGKNLSFEAKEK